jgi:hypothetical protein
MSDTKDLYSRITIYTATATETDDCYSTGEVITTAEDYSVDIDHQVQIFDATETDIDHEVNIYESYAVDLDHQIVVCIPLSSDIDHQEQIYDADSIDIDHEVNIYESYAVDLDHQIVVWIPLSSDIDHQNQIYDAAETDIDHHEQIYENLETDIDHQSQIFENDETDIDEQVQIYEEYRCDIDEQIHLVGFLLPAIGNVGLPDWHSDLPSEAEVITQLDIDHQIQIYSSDETDIDHQVEIYSVDEVDIDHQVQIYSVDEVDIDHQVQIYSVDEVDIDHQVQIYEADEVDIDHHVEIYSSDTTDIDHQVNIFTTPDSVDIDHQVKIILVIPSPMFLIYEADESEIHDYTNRVESIGVIRRYLGKSFGITQVSNVDVVCENSDKVHTYLHPDGDFYPTSKYIWTWAKITCGWGVDLDQNVQAQFQGLVETLELTEARSCNFVIVDILKEIIDGKLATAITFDQNLVDTTPLESLNPIHIVEYLINEVLGAEVFDFSTETFVAACDPNSFDAAYTACSTYVVNDTTWPAESSIIQMIQDALKLVQGWIYTNGNGRIKAKVYPSVLPTGLEKHFIGSETRDDRKIMNFRLHPSRRDVINYVKWTYGQANNEYGPTLGVASIAQYGYRPLELSTGWEVDTSVLLNISGQLLFRYQQPPDVITFGTSNLYGSGDGLDAELGEVIKVTDDGIGIEDRYFFIIEKRDDLLGRQSELVAEEYAAT